MEEPRCSEGGRPCQLPPLPTQQPCSWGRGGGGGQGGPLGWVMSLGLNRTRVGGMKRSHHKSMCARVFTCMPVCLWVGTWGPQQGVP